MHQALALQIMRVPSDLEGADEFLELIGAAGMHCRESRELRCRRIDSHTFIGRGQAEAIGELIRESGIDLVAVNQRLEPSQERNLERSWQIPVLDRISIILDIFAQRAHTHEGKLQVELAQLEHLSTRLVRGWSHLERQKGGIGLRGPGETQLETDRRLIGQRMQMLKRRLQKVRRQRGLERRRRSALPTISLVGYANAGKSTLFNRLSGSDSRTANQMFSTLDPLARRMSLPSGRQAALTDTVGFVSDLPHELVAAFSATLEQVRAADLLLHVIDAHDIARRERHVSGVEQAIARLGADGVPQLQVWNKADLLPGPLPPPQGNGLNGRQRISVSALTGVGVDGLLCAIDASLDRIDGSETCCLRIDLPPQAGGLRAQLHELGVVRGANGCRVEVSANRRILERVCMSHGLCLDDLLAPVDGRMPLPG